MPADPHKELEALKATMSRFHPEKATSMVEEAYYFSMNAHAGQRRESGEPYFMHPFAVARILAEKGMDEVVVTAALLHDIVEDTKVERKDILAKFGKDVYGLVEGLTKLNVIAFKSRQAQSAANITKTIMAASKDIRVLVIKLFDKLHNMRTLHFLDAERRKRIAADALTVYVPIAHKLGMNALRFELEDICFQTLEPEKFKEVKRSVDRSRSDKARVIQRAIMMLKNRHPDMAWRLEEKHKSYYSTYSKMIAQDKKITEISDTLILKIVVQGQNQCYLALGKVHDTFKPIPGKMKDLIALPEYAVYKGLHTQVIGPDKKPLKVHIYCEEMNAIADEGIMALLRGNSKEAKGLFRKYSHIFPLTNPQEASDSVELADNLNLDYHNRAMVVFTEKGDVVDLPLGSTALDFAFFTDEKAAKRAAKAEVNGRVVPLWTILDAGDRVKMHYSLMSQLNTKWESFVHANKSRKMIEKELGKKNIHTNNKLAKITIGYLDTPTVFSRQAEVLAKYSLDLEVVRGSCKSDRTSCSTEYYVRNTDSAKMQKALKELRDMQETLDLNVDYVL